jgi:two-component system CheB/CheR fusion protein
VNVSKITAAEARISELTADLRNRLQSLETLLNLLPVGVLIVEDSRTGEVRVNRHGARLLGQREDGTGPRMTTASLRLFKGDRELSPQENPLYQAAHSGQAMPGFEGELLRGDGSRVSILMSATPMFAEDGRARGGIAGIVDISERKTAEAHQQVLLYELQHRVKNILATISALASRMVSGSKSLEEFSSAFLGRLRIMAATHELLSRGNWTGAGLRDLIETAVGPHLPKAGPGLVMNGPDITLSPAAISTLGMVIYELATNAVKYGGLSVPGGRVEISWSREPRPDGPQLLLTWEEIGGPALAFPLKEGFGTAFMKRSVEYEMNGSVVLAPRPTGLHCTVSFPLHGNLQNSSNA